MRSEKFLYCIFLLYFIACKPLSHTDHKFEKVLVTENSELPTNPVNYKIIGTEPFWACEIKGDSVLFSNAEGVHISQIILSKDSALNFTSENLRIRLLPEECSDGMSERKYNYKAKVTLDNFSLEGCAFIIE